MIATSTNTSVKQPQFRRSADATHAMHTSQALTSASPLPVSRARRASVEVDNHNGKPVCGIEIELTGLAPDASFHAYYLNRFGTPKVWRNDGAVRIRFEGEGRLSFNSLTFTAASGADETRNNAHPHVWEFALFGGSAERFCLELSTLDLQANYRWLLVDGDANGGLVPDSEIAYVFDPRPVQGLNEAQFG